ncbi:MAG: PorP/SprF family type IX secretion system membrane protein [Saprospiraceae bacterium]|nr:PorP/SprF family type IX secretion system membrane protein [Saprospiraceae bacterium]
MMQILWIAGMIVCFNQVAFSQDPVFSQFYNAPLQLNPAFAGNTNGPSFHLNYRNQWPALGNIYTTTAISYSQFFRKINSGFGGSILVDNAGDGTLKTSRFALNYSYRLKVNQKSYIKGGIETTLGNISLDWDRFIFGDAIDPRLGSVSPGGLPFPSAETRPLQNSINYFGVSSGILYSHPDYYFGVTLRNLNTPDISFLSQQGRNNNDGYLPLFFSLHGGYKFTIRERNKFREDAFIMPNVLIAGQSGFRQVNFGSIFAMNKLLLGVWYRLTGSNADAVIGSVGVRKDFLRISYSFDYTTSALSIRQGGSHEVGISLNFDYLYPEKVNYNDCFNIFR